MEYPTRRRSKRGELEGDLRFGKAAVSSASRLAERYLATGMTLYLRMRKSHRQGSTAKGDKRELRQARIMGMEYVLEREKFRYNEVFPDMRPDSGLVLCHNRKVR